MFFVVALAWLLGAGSLLLFGFFLWTNSLQLVDMRLATPALIAWDAGLCLLFFLQHSVLIRRSVRDSLMRYVPEYCHRVVYTITSGIALIALVLMWQRSSTVFYAFHGAGRLSARVILLLAIAGFFWGIRSLQKFDAFGIDAFLAHVRGTELPAPPLTAAGPYRYVRHPFYAFALLALWATPVLSVDRLLLNALFTGWIVLGASLEERDLLAEFGESYGTYRRSVPMFVPRLSLARSRRANAMRRGAGK